MRSSGFHPDQVGSIPSWRTGCELVWSFSARLKSERTSFDSTAADRVAVALVSGSRCDRDRGVRLATATQLHRHVSPLAWTAACQAVSRSDRNRYVARMGRRPWWPTGFQSRRTAFDSLATRWFMNQLVGGAGAPPTNTGMCRRLRACFASRFTRSVTEHLHPGSRPMARSAAWYAARADSISDGSSSLAVARLVPVGANAQRGPGSGRRVSERPRRKGECSRQEHFRACDVQRKACRSSKPDVSVRFRARAPTTSSTGVRRALQTRDGSARFRCSSPINQPNPRRSS